MRSILIFFVALWGTTSSWAEIALDGKMPEDLIPQLREIIDSALQGNGELQQRSLLEQEAMGRRVVARSSMLPSFSADVAFRKERDEEAVLDNGFEDRVIYSITLSQPLYHWGSLKSEKQIGDILYDIEKLNTQGSVEDVIGRVRRDYMLLVLSKQRREKSQSDLEEAQAKLDFQLEQIEAGAASTVSKLPFDLSVQRAELALLKDATEWENQVEEFSIYVFMDPLQLESLVVDVIPKFEPLDLDELNRFSAYFSSGFENDETLQRLDLDLEVEKRRLSIVRNTLLPKVNAQLGLNSNALDVDGTRREQSYAFFGFRVGWNIFDGYRRKGLTMEALSRMTRKENTKERALDAVERKYERLVKQLEIESRSLAIEELVLEAGQGRLEWITKSYENELVPVNELDQAKREFNNTLLRTQSVRISYLMALSQLATELGLDSAATE